jgi:23S rRNA (uracil1939-C5)-methyltransferase
MVVVVFNSDDRPRINGLLEHLHQAFPGISSLYFVINPKKNDVISDLPFHLYAGNAKITERMLAYDKKRELQFGLGPVSFYQTNSDQAENLYRLAGDLAGFEGNELVYDLYTGTGTIANFIAGSVQKVVGIESVETAIEDAYENAARNGITNTVFYSGEAEKILTAEFIQLNGIPDIVITDPPRNGMHGKVINMLLDLSPRKIIYVSCNPATQARDIALLSEKFTFEKCQPADMFPHTQHVENVALLTRKN